MISLYFQKKGNSSLNFQLKKMLRNLNTKFLCKQHHMKFINRFPFKILNLNALMKLVSYISYKFHYRNYHENSLFFIVWHAASIV